MGLVTQLKNTVANKFPRAPVVPKELGPDFTDGLLVRELTWNGTALDEVNQIRLKGTNLPIQPLEWQGEQRIIKEFYPGNIEPAMQVLGPREANIVLRGRFKAKRLNVSDVVPGFSDPAELRVQPYELQEYFDAMRLRGNIIELTLGEWQRYGFIERAKFAMKTLADIDYELEFNVIGVNPPFFNFFAEEVQAVPYDINVALAVNGAAYATVSLDPDLPTDIFDTITEAVSAVADAIAILTNFVDGVMSIADDVTKHYNRAIGLCTYLRGQIAQYKRRIGALQLDIADAPAALDEYAKQTWLMVNSKTIYDLAHAPNQPLALTTAEQEAALAQLSTFATSRQQVDVDNRGYPTYEQAQNIRDTLPLDVLVQRMLSQFRALYVAIPVRKHIVRQGDTLQKISLLYYKAPGLWEKIYDHNKLDSTDISGLVGTELEIPRL